MVSSSAHVGDDLHEKEINVQNAKMSGSNQQKQEENVGFANNNVCLHFLTLIFFWLYRKNIYSCSSACMKVLLYESS